MSNNYVQLELKGSIPDDDGIYEVYRDDIYIGSLDNKKLIDTNVMEKQTYTYKIIGKKERSDVEKEEVQKYIKEHNIIIDAIQLKELYQKPYEMIRVVNVPSSLDETIEQLTLEPLVSATPLYVFRYKTFIPDCMVSALSIVQGLAGYQFGGDCRGFSFNETEKYRTYVESPISFTGTGSSLDTTGRFVGWTYLYNGSGTLVESRRASNSGIVYSNITKSYNQLSYTLTHGVAIPFGNAPEINYKYTVTMNRGGSFVVEGSRDQAPNHEFYVYSPTNDIWSRTLIQATNKGFEYLFPIYPNATFKISY
ncbi:DUF3238 domain-containing protein [Metasolibacillus sp. FSL K6-0083]